ncbi:MAG TPA: hypothetical protein VF627_00815 [Abditibacterium sp.]|jgi:hypothetical protein
MSITIEHPTAEAVWQAIQQLPVDEMERLRQLFNRQPEETPEEEENAWRAASAHSAARFFEEEDAS